jgi:hypothetical protein
MRPSVDIFLCGYEAADGPRELRAVLDELTLTYCIVERGADSNVRRLRRHVPSVRQARCWAVTHAEGAETGQPASASSARRHRLGVR